MKIGALINARLDPDLSRWMRDVAHQVNALSEGRSVALYQAGSSAPTTGTFAQGDFVANNAPSELGAAGAKYVIDGNPPSELGAAGAKYVIDGWKCVAGGTPGTWVQCRFLTGN